METVAIRTKHLKRKFGVKGVLKDINLEIGKGEKVLLKGRNGSGKTTLLKILCTLMAPTEGEAWIGGFSVFNQARKIRSIISWVPACDNSFVPRFTGFENLLFFGALYKIDKKKADSCIDKWRIFPVVQSSLDTPFYLCSSGMKQSLFLIRAILSDPQILFMDEPARYMEYEFLSQISPFLEEELKSKTVFYSSHSERDPIVYPNRSYCLTEGVLS